jgi:hypothetical protein
VPPSTWLIRPGNRCLRLSGTAGPRPGPQLNGREDGEQEDAGGGAAAGGQRQRSGHDGRLLSVRWSDPAPRPGRARRHRAGETVAARLALSAAVRPALRADGVIPAGVRFQVEYPTPLASIGAYIVPEQQQALLGSYQRAMFADLGRLLAAIPGDDVAVQWDVAVEFGVLEEAFAPGGAQAVDAIIAALARCIDQVPAEIPAGLHLCYGDYSHHHFKQPESLALQVRVLNAVTVAAGRPVSFVSFTVPQYQRQDRYFAPLAGLTADPGTELNFALVPYHPAEQAPGTTADQVRLIDTALAASPCGGRDWGICTECGMGRASRDEIPALLDLHRHIVAAR